MTIGKNIGECEICHKPRAKGGHPACSKIKQKRALEANGAKKQKATSKMYATPRLLTGFLKTIGS